MANKEVLARNDVARAVRSITTQKGDKIRLIRLSKSKMLIADQDGTGMDVIVSGDRSVHTVAESFWGGVWDGIKSAAGAVAGAAKDLIKGCNPKTTTTVDVKDGKVTSIKTETSCG